MSCKTLMMGPVIHTPLLDRMSTQLQFTLGNTKTTKLLIYGFIYNSAMAYILKMNTLIPI
jgi:hypothetical protein